MRFEYRYHGSSAVAATPASTSMSFAPDTFRAPTYFDGKLNLKVPFREAISALHAVVVSDHRFTPRDTSAYKEWAAQQELQEFGELAADTRGAAERYSQLADELAELQTQRSAIMGPYYKAQRKYFDYLYRKNRDFWIVLDPVITVHPDQVFFECFSQDESSYGRLAASYEVFETSASTPAAPPTSTTRRRSTTSSRRSALQGDAAARRPERLRGRDHRRGALQRSQDRPAGELGARLPPGQLGDDAAGAVVRARTRWTCTTSASCCVAARSARAALDALPAEPGQPVRVVFEPWNSEITCRARSTRATRRRDPDLGAPRLHVLERLIPVARRFTVHLLGTGMPSFFVADLGDMSFTLGLSGWTANDWSRPATST